MTLVTRVNRCESFFGGGIYNLGVLHSNSRAMATHNGIPAGGDPFDGHIYERIAEKIVDIINSRFLEGVCVWDISFTSGWPKKTLRINNNLLRHVHDPSRRMGGGDFGFLFF